LPDVEEVVGFGRSSEANRSCGVDSWDSMRFLLRDAEGRIAQVAGTYTLPTLAQEIEPSIGCIIRGSEGTTQGEYPNLVYHTHFAGEEPITHSMEELHDYYFRFEGKSHHAGEYQNYIEYFAECLDAGTTPLPDAGEAVRTLAVMVAMERSIADGGRVVRVRDVLDEYLKG
jgi:predicted dehydrogenase